MTPQQLAELLLGIARAQAAMIQGLENEMAGVRSGRIIPALQNVAHLRDHPQPTLTDLPVRVLLGTLGRQVPDTAGMWPLALAQFVAVPTVVLLATALGSAWVPRGRRVRWAALAGPLGATATLAFLLASQQGFLTVAGVLASLYPASTVLLAALVLREHIYRVQGVGLALCAVAIGFVAGG